MDETGEPKRKWGIIPSDFGMLRAKVREISERAGSSESFVRAVAERADRILQRLEGTSEVLEKAARLELRILEKLEPIVDDLGTLVRVQLAQALGRPVGERRGGPSGRDERHGDAIIDVTDMTDAPDVAGGPGVADRPKG